MQNLFIKKLLLLSVLLIAGAGLALLAHAHPGSGHSPAGEGYGRAHGMGHSMGRGMGHSMGRRMGRGMGMGMMHFLEELPEAKRDKLEQLKLTTGQAMMAKRFEMRKARRKLREAMQKFPLNSKAAESHWQALNNVRREMFRVRLGMMAQMQQIVGKELWDKMHSEREASRHGERGMRHR